MRRLVVLMCLGMLVAATLCAVVMPGSAQNVFFHKNVQVNDDATSSEQTACDISYHTTDIYVVWQDSRNSDRDIFFSISTSHGLNFQTNVRVDDGGTSDATSPAMAVDKSSGTIYVAWADKRSGDGRIRVANSTDKGATFGASVRVDDDAGTGYDFEYPDITVTATGAIVVAWTDQRGGNRDVYLSRSIDGGVTWTADIRLDDDPGTEDQTNVALTSYNNDVYAVWEDDRTTNLDVHFRKSTDGGATFPSASVQVAALAQSQKTPSISVDELGNIYVAWTDFFGSNYNINCANSTNGGTSFSALNKVDNGGTGTSQYDPSIYAFNSSHLMCAWTDNQGDSSENIFFGISDNMGVTWNNHTQADDAPAPPTNQILPVVVSNSTGDAQLVWVDNRNGDRDIFFGQMDYDIPPVNLPPQLAHFNITPTFGSPNTNFMFQITYTDLDGDGVEGGYPKLYVYSNLAGTVPYKTGTYVMDQMSSMDTDVTDGKDYVKTLTFEDDMNFTYKYQVRSDANLDIISSPLLIGPSIDNKAVLFAQSSVGNDMWYTRSDVWCNVTISDLNGSGVDGDNILYRHSKTGMANVSRWYQIPDKPHNESIFMFKAMVFTEGDQNYIQWNASDLAGNGPTFSDAYNIKIDMSEIKFADESPATGTKINQTEADLQVTVTDTDPSKIADGVVVSGVDTSSLEYREKHPGGDWSEWNSTGLTITTSNATHHRLLVHINNITKGSNLVQFRGNDLAGTGKAAGTVSAEYSIVLDDSVNFAPTAPGWISPNSTTDTTPKISWGGESDAENDALTYFIQIGTPTQKDYILPWASTGSNAHYDVMFELKKDMTYLIQLKCFDGNQYSPVFETGLDITSTGNQPPAPPANIQPKVTTVYNPTITWDPSDDPDSFNIIYFIQISSSAGMGDLLPWTQVFGTETKYDVAGTLGLSDGSYIIELQAFDGLDYSDIAESTLKIATFEIQVDNFASDLTVGEVSTYTVKFTNLGTATDNIKIYMLGTIFDQAVLFIDDTEFVNEGDAHIAYSMALAEAKDMKIQFRVKADAAPGTYSLSFEVFSESGEKTGELIKNDVGIKAGSGGPNPNGTDDDDDDTGFSPDKLIRDYWWALLIALAVILILAVFIGVASSKGKKKDEEEERRKQRDDMYSDRGGAEVEDSPHDRPPEPRYDSPPPRRDYPSKAAPMYAEQQQPQESFYDEPQVDQGDMAAMMAQQEPVVEYSDEDYQDYQEPPEDDDEPKDIYGYDEDDDLDDLDMEPIEEEVDENPDEDDENYLNIDDM